MGSHEFFATEVIGNSEDIKQKRSRKEVGVIIYKATIGSNELYLVLKLVDSITPIPELEQVDLPYPAQASQA
jgi:hypothetical protein